MSAQAPDLSSLMEAQRDVVTTLDRRVFVAAGAGSGKTFTLTKRIVWALSPGSGKDGKPYLDNLEQALIITYTEKAAAEIRDRVRSSLVEAGFTEEALRVDGAWISTIHGMCSRILHRHALDLGLDPEFSIVVEHQVEELRNSAADAAIAEMEATSELSALQEAFPITSESSRSGDDFRSMALMLMDKASSAQNGFDDLKFIGADVDVDELMHDMLTVYETLIAQKELCATSEKGQTELAECIHSLDKLREYVLYPPSQKTPQSAYECARELHRPNGQFWKKEEVKYIREEVQHELDQLKALLSLALASQLEKPLLHLAKRAFELFSAEKQSRRVLDNDDLLRLTFQAFRTHPDLANYYAQKFLLVMIDEFQDTNAQQVEMIRLLSGKDASHLCTVGDAQQSIYRFRGADVDVFRRYEKQSQDKVVRLVRNFRSHDDILRLVERVCDQGGLISDFMDLEAQPNRENIYLNDGTPRIYLEFARGIKSSGKGAKAPTTDTRRSLNASMLASRFVELHKKGIPFGRMALLLGSMSNVHLYLNAFRAAGIDCVVTGGSGFSQSSEAKSVSAFLHVLANPKDTQDGLFPLLTSDMFSLDADDLCTLSTRQQQGNGAPAKQRIYPGITEPLYDGLERSDRLAHAQEVLKRAWKSASSKPIADVCLDAIRESGWIERLQATGTEGQAHIANLVAAVRYVRELTEETGAGPAFAAREFDRWLLYAKRSPASLSGSSLDAVQVMTVHKSKGLEFDVVGLAECYGTTHSTSAPRLIAHEYSAIDGKSETAMVLSLKPKDYAFDAKCLGEDRPLSAKECTNSLEWRVWLEDQEKAAAVQELGRLIYVGLTRAKEALVLCAQGLPKKDGSLDSASGVLTENVLTSLIDPMCEAGTHSFDYGGSLCGEARVVDMRLNEDGSIKIDAAGALDEQELFDLISSEKAQASEQSPAQEDAFIVPEFEELEYELTGWRPRESVFSYSSAHTKINKGEAALDEVLMLPVSVKTDESIEATMYTPEHLVTTPATDYVEPADSEPEDEEAQPLADTDRATNIGSAFHELARYMVETSSMPSETRVELVAKAYGVTKRDCARLSSALKRWEHSKLREEVLSYSCVRAEVPFFYEVDTSFGEYLEGAIDLLATNDLGSENSSPAQCQDSSHTPASLSSMAASSALLVDYKTGDMGLSYKQIRTRHEMQARFYAYALQRMGYTEITCAFVCVELEDSAGEPVVVRYQFGKADQTL